MVVKKKTSTFVKVLRVVLIVAALAGIAYLIYRLYGKQIKAAFDKIKCKVKGVHCIDDNEPDASLFDTSDDGEVSTVILHDEELVTE